jgi:hypothetical protein
MYLSSVLHGRVFQSDRQTRCIDIGRFRAERRDRAARRRIFRCRDCSVNQLTGFGPGMQYEARRCVGI